MTNEIHTLRMQREAMKKDVLFRRQRVEKIEENLRRIGQELERTIYDQEDVNKQVGVESQEQMETREDNKRMKQALERMREESR